jgi:hypothetical protein
LFAESNISSSSFSFRFQVREAKEAQAAVPGGEGIELLLGGTTLLTPSDMYDLLLGSRGSM